MIDISQENVITLAEATRRLPRRRKGKRPHVATLYCWVDRGIRGIHLEAIRVGGTLCTSVEALQRFCERLSAPNGQPTAKTSPSRRAAVARADRSLDKAGL